MGRYIMMVSDDDVEDYVQLSKKSVLVLDQCLDDLYETRGSTREKALATIIETFNNILPHMFVNSNKFVTLWDRCLNSIKHGSVKEINLASHAIGLLSLTAGPGEEVQGLLEESVSCISEALISCSDEALKMSSSLLDCLAIITFVGGGCEREETEKSMQIMWQVVHQKLNVNDANSKPSSTTIIAVISAWSFLLTRWTLTSKSWRESLSYFSTLLDKDDRSVRMAAGEALALIFEIGILETFSDIEDNSLWELSKIQELRTKIISQMRSLSAEAGGKGCYAKEELKKQRVLFRDILQFFEDGYCPETSVKIGGQTLKTRSWSELIQLNFIKRFLGAGFVKHMQENEFLHDVFGFTGTEKQHLSSKHRVSKSKKKMLKSPNSLVNKERTKYLNKQRMLSRDLNAGLFGLE